MTDILPKEAEITASYEGTDTIEFLNDSSTWKSIESEDGVESVIPVAVKGFYDDERNEFIQIVAISSDYWQEILDSEKTRFSSGITDLSLASNNSSIPVVVYSTNLFNQTGPIIVTDYDQKSHTLNILGWVTFEKEETVLLDSLEVYYDDAVTTRVFITLLPFMDEFAGEYYPSLKINVDSTVLNMKDIDGSTHRLNLLVKTLILKYKDYYFSSYYIIQLQLVKFVIIAYFTICVIFLLPFFFIALYLSKLASELNLESRRVYHGLYLSRGIATKTMSRANLAEGVILGSLIGLIAFMLTPITGVLLATQLPVTIPTTTFLETCWFYYVRNIQSLGWSVLIGAVLGGFITRLPSYYLRLSTAELLHQYRQEEAETTSIRGRRDVFILLAGLYPIGSALALYIAISFNVPVIFFIIIWFASSYALYVAPFSPFLISYGLSSILSRQPRILTAIARFYTQFLPELRPITVRVIKSRMHRISRIAFVLALSFTFIVFPVILSESLQHHAVKSADYSRGGYERIKIDVDWNSNLTRAKLDSRSEIESLVKIHVLNTETLTVIYTNTTEYAKTANIAAFWGITREELSSLNPDSVLVSKAVISELHFTIGEQININDTSYTITGTFLGLGGTGINSRLSYSVILNEPLDTDVIGCSYIIKLKDYTVTSINSLMTFVSATDPNAVFHADSTMLADGQTPEEFNMIEFVIRILETQAVLLAFTSLGALGFLMVIRVRERTKEIGTWRSRGMSDKQLLQSIIIETASIATLGYFAGFLTGGAMVIGFQGLITGLITEGGLMVPIDIVLPINLWILWLVMVIGVIIIAIIVAFIAVTSPVSKQIRYEDYV
ncbi:MAG: FtsX-like permease family protein [Candidatus Hodarchaeales archaeon]